MEYTNFRRIKTIETIQYAMIDIHYLLRKNKLNVVIYTDNNCFWKILKSGEFLNDDYMNNAILSVNQNEWLNIANKLYNDNK